MSVARFVNALGRFQKREQNTSISINGSDVPLNNLIDVHIKKSPSEKSLVVLTYSVDDIISEITD